MHEEHNVETRFHQRIRLDRAVYADPSTICSVTIAVKNRRPVFSDPRVATATVETLRDRASKTGVPIYGYCVMPDHVHLVLGSSPTCDIVTFVGQFKNLSQRQAWSLVVKCAFWQTSFWDHALRKDEDPRRAVAYVLENPVRKGLSRDVSDYPFAGSWVFEF